MGIIGVIFLVITVCAMCKLARLRRQGTRWPRLAAVYKAAVTTYGVPTKLKVRKPGQTTSAEYGFICR